MTYLNFDSEYGICYKDNTNSIILGPDLKYRDMNLKRKLLSIYQNSLSSITLLPVEFDCDGDCSFCFQKSKKHMIRHMTNDDLKEHLKKLMMKFSFISPTLKIRLFGGDAFKHENIVSLVQTAYDTIKVNYPTIRFSIQLFLDGFWKDTNRIVSNIISLQSKDYISSLIIYTNLNLGSKLRFSKKLNIDSSGSISNILYVLNNISFNKVLNVNNIHLANDTNVDKLKSDLNNLESMPSIFSFSIIKDENFHPSIDVLSKFYDTFKSDVCLEFSTSGLRYCNEFVKKNDLDKDNFNFISINDSVKIIDPMDLLKACPIGLTGITISKEHFYRCCSGNFKPIDLDNPNFTNEEIQFYSSKPQHCLDCEFYGICFNCNWFRHKYPCSTHTYIKYWYGILSKIIENKINE